MLVALLTIVAACAPKTIPSPVVVRRPAAEIPRLHRSRRPPSFAGTPPPPARRAAGKLLQAGDLKSAEREFGAALKLTPAFYPAEAGLGYVELAREDAKAALPHFDRALERESAQLSALVGRGRSLLALNREPEALAAFEAALVVDPSLADLARRVEVMRFRGQQDDLNRARAAALAGRFEEAIASTHAPSRVRPTARSCIASWRRLNGNTARTIARWSITSRPPRSSPAMRHRASRSGRCSKPAAISRARPRHSPRRSRSSRTPIWRRSWKSCEPEPTSRGCPRSIGRIEPRRRSRVAIWPRSSACGSRGCCRTLARARRWSSPTSAPTGRRPGLSPSLAPA